ncbi:DNA-binding transcriptional response regulator [Roseicyclus marinus]|uniref:hypothetical protein n=1 Tax=Roseicyclus marinus TaxID=2161673 RepID=UPI0024105298|nr:hypothetical protein [Roseicyclus marinus]MDG3041858.1 hypothetical protein [Roseicyclus marinus]
MALWYGLKGWVSALSGDRAGKTAEAEDSALERHASGPATGVAQSAAAHILGSEVCKRRIMLVADPMCQILEHATWLDQHTHGVELCSGLPDAKDRAAQFSEDAIVVIGIDYFVDLDAAITALAQFRMDAPDLPIVMGSVTFARLDLSCERAMIADASIRLPVTRPQLALSLGAALTNHRVMMARLAELSERRAAQTGVPSNDPIQPVYLPH